MTHITNTRGRDYAVVHELPCCGEPALCWEPCGHLGHDAAFAVRASPEMEREVDAALVEVEPLTDGERREREYFDRIVRDAFINAEIVNLVRAKLRSDNSVPMERCVITAAEVQKIEADVNSRSCL